MQKQLYNVVSILSLIVCIVAGFKNQVALTTMCFLASMAFLFIANLDKIKKAKASKDGFEFEAREVIRRAEVTIVEMQNIAKIVAKTTLSLIKRSNRWDGYPLGDQERDKNAILKLLSDLDITLEDRNSILEEFNKFIEIDYCFLLLGSHVPFSWAKEEQARRKEMLTDILDSWPTPDEIVPDRFLYQ